MGAVLDVGEIICALPDASKVAGRSTGIGASQRARFLGSERKAMYARTSRAIKERVTDSESEA